MKANEQIREKIKDLKNEYSKDLWGENRLLHCVATAKIKALNEVLSYMDDKA